MDLQPPLTIPSVRPGQALWRLLDDLDVLLNDVPIEVYTARFASEVCGSIGEHVRHCLDHVATLVTADPSAPLSYDQRQRGTAVEASPTEARRQVQYLQGMLDQWSARPLHLPIRVMSMVSPSGETVAARSTLARELAFVMSHTIHHQAIIAVLLAVHGHAVPAGFGHSPSTPRRN